MTIPTDESCAELNSSAHVILLRFVALTAMVLQVLFFTDHIGAVAAKALGGASADARLGFMEICTGNGIVIIGPDGVPVEQEHNCPICENASVMAFGEPQTIADPLFPFIILAVAWSIPAQSHAADLRFPGQKPIRAPPSILS